MGPENKVDKVGGDDPSSLVVGVDVGERRTVFAFVGKAAEEVHRLALSNASRVGVPMKSRAKYEAMFDAFVADITYPSVRSYRGNELSSAIVVKAFSAVLDAANEVVRGFGGVATFVFEDLRDVKGEGLNAVKEFVWKPMINALGGLGNGSSWCVVRVNWSWFTTIIEVHVVKGSTALMLVSPEHTSHICPRCTRYLSYDINRIKRAMKLEPQCVTLANNGAPTIKCDYCGFVADKDVLAAITIAVLGHLATQKYLGGESCAPRGGWAWVCSLVIHHYFVIVEVSIKY